ncbi:MAG: cation transporter [Devosia sp.]|uniref:cation diffusion facilitator family transporter n=1 Tax=Devosia sp. 66-22 TaxID=1895753 RepID=UPI0009262294|nr:cation diffusion facilitator family transporter [Devosia sp. 66-22]MBN9348886.1 cation transporter [Devosia sp.]OJX54552.1 MAG: cation transporter [Devosia sp. 66-22]
MAAQSGSRIVVYAALAGNFLIAVTKFIAAAFTGSSAMLSEGVHSLVDTGNELLLLYGLHRAAKPPDREHPFGHGRELYFWSFVVAVLIFALGAGVSIYEGVRHVMQPEPMENATVNYIVLGLSIVFETASWLVALREFRREKGELGYLAAIRESKDPTTFTVLVEDSVALLGLLIALAGIFTAQALDMPVLDGVASIGIGLLLAATAFFLARESKNLLLGEQALPAVQQAILLAAQADEEIRHVNGVSTSQIGPHVVIAALSAEFEDHLTTPQIEACIERVEAAVRSRHPEVLSIFIKPQTEATWRERVAEISRLGAG